MATHDVNVVVVGGGPAGAATALALRQAGVGSVLVVEAGSHSGFRIGESLPPDGRLVLERLGVFADFQQQNHDPCQGSCSVWGDPRVGYNDFLLNPNGHGWHLDRRRFDAFLLARAEAAGARVWRNRQVVACETRRSGAKVTIAGGGDKDRRETLSCRLVVDATGARARVARSLGAHVVHDDAMICLSAVVPMEPATPVNSLTRLEAVAEGWWYAARLPGQRLMLALTTDAGALRASGLDDPAAWLEALRRTSLLAPLRGEWESVAARLTLRRDPILSGALDVANGPSWFAVGDAATTMDPLFSAGMHKAMSNGVALSEVIAGHLKGNRRAAEAWQPHLDRNREAYLRERQRFYFLERRWPDAPFWAARRAATEQAVGLDLAAAE